MLSFHSAAPPAAGKTPASFASRLTVALARMLPGAHQAPGEELPQFRGRNQLREDIGLLPLDRDGLPL